MNTKIIFTPYRPSSLADCLALFDANCPEFFAANERDDYAAFLAKDPAGYELILLNEHVVGAFGFSLAGRGRSRLSWILLNPHQKGFGIGATAMARVISLAHAAG